MGHRVALLLQLFLFAFRQTGIRQLVVLELQEVAVLTVALDVFLQLLQTALGGLIVGEGMLVVGELFVIVGDDVRHAELEVLLVEQQVLVLRVDVDEPFAKFLEHRQLHGRIVDEGAALACGRQFAPYDAVASVVFDVVVAEEVLHVVACQVELCLDDALVCTLHDGLGISPLPQQQSDGAEDDALARTCLTRDD